MDGVVMNISSHINDIQDIMEKTALEMEQAGIEGSQRYTREVFDFAEEHGIAFISMTEEEFGRMEQFSQ